MDPAERRPREHLTAGEPPTHPKLAAGLLMGAVVVLLVLLSAVSL